MWKHEILEYFERAPFSKQFPAWKEVAELVMMAETFYFGDVSGIDEIKAKEHGKELPLWLDVPYDVTLLEWEQREFHPERKENPFEQEYEAPKRAILVKSDRRTQKQTCWSFYYLDSGDVQERLGIKIQGWLTSTLTMHFEPDGISVRPWLIDGINPNEEREINLDVSSAYVFLNVLNCRNIITKTVTPPEKLNRKRIKNKHYPYYSYKVLEISNTVAKVKDQGSVGWDYLSQTRGAENRFHLCRGHFKTYSPERPLFGKHAGTFWWNAQARGSVQEGVVVKDYSIDSGGLAQKQEPSGGE